MRGLCTAVLLVGMGGATAASAQEQTASIVGTVVDVNGGVLAGSVVTARHEGGLAATTVTDEAGRFRFPSLPPGRFDVTAEFAGFAPARVEGVAPRLGEELHVSVTLEQATLSETVRVVADSRTIAITQSSRSHSLRDEDLTVLPSGREFTDVVNQISGANLELTRSEGQIAIEGSSAGENRFIIDGVESTDLTTGVAGGSTRRRTVTDFLDEIQVKSSGYTAEFGGSTGAVVNAITRSGANAWHGDALLYWEADGLDAQPRPTLELMQPDPTQPSAAEYVTYPKDDYHGLEPGFTLGGPILRDKLWFFAGYIPRFGPISRTAPFFDGTTSTLTEEQTFHQGVANVTGQVGASWRFRTGFTFGHQRVEGLLHNQDGTSSPNADYDQIYVEPTWSVSGSVDWTPSPSYFMSVRGGYWVFDSYTENVYEGDYLFWRRSSLGLAGVPSEYQRPSFYENVPTNDAIERNRQGRLSLQWDNTFFFEGAGRHQLKTGIQLDRRSYDILRGGTGNAIDIWWNGSYEGHRGDYGYYRVRSNALEPNRSTLRVGDVHSDGVGLFVQDSWSLGDRLTLNLGLRTETESLPSYSRDPRIPDTVVHFGFGDKLAPRLGFAWDATGDGRTKVYGSWGVFYDILKFQVNVFGQFIQSDYYYTLDDPDLSTIENNLACPPQCPGRLLDQTSDDGFYFNNPDDPRVEPELKPMKLQEFVFGIEREIAPRVVLGVRYIRKRLDRTIEDLAVLDSEGDEQYWLGNPGFGVADTVVLDGGETTLPYPRARRDYDGVEIGLSKRMANGWSGRVFYLWSHLRGNDSGLAQTGYPPFSGINPNFGRTWDSVIMPFDQDTQPLGGPLFTDRRHQIKAQLVYQLPIGTSLGASWYGASGIPKTRGAFVRPFLPVYQEGLGSDGRMPFTSQLDVQVMHQFSLNEGLRLTLTATIFNLFNQGGATDYFQWRIFDQVVMDPDEYLQGFDMEQVIDEQQIPRDPRFMMDEYFRPPRSIRLGMRLSF